MRSVGRDVYGHGKRRCDLVVIVVVIAGRSLSVRIEIDESWGLPGSRGYQPNHRFIILVAICLWDD